MTISWFNYNNLLFIAYYSLTRREFLNLVRVCTQKEDEFLIIHLVDTSVTLNIAVQEVVTIKLFFYKEFQLESRAKS